MFLAKEQGHGVDYSDEVASTIDAEVQALVDDAHEEAREILTVHRAVLDQLADELIEHESLEGEFLETILAKAGSAVSDSLGAASATSPSSKLSGPAPVEQFHAEGTD